MRAIEGNRRRAARRTLVAVSTMLVLVASLLPSTALAANSRVVYFGSPSNEGGTGGSIDPLTGHFLPGTITFTEVNVGGLTAVDILIRNDSPSTLTQNRLTGGLNVPLCNANPGFLPPPPIYDSATGTCAPSLAPSSFYAKTYVFASDPVTLASAVICDSPPTTGFSCAVPNLAATNSVMIRVIIGPNAVQDIAQLFWFAFSTKEGGSSTGGNQDTVFAYGYVTETAANCSSAAGYFLDTQQVDFGTTASGCTQTTALKSNENFGGQGTFAKITIGGQTACPGKIVCFGNNSNGSVVAGTTTVPGGLQWTIFWSSTLYKGKVKGWVHFHNDYIASDPTTFDVINFTNSGRCPVPLGTARNCWVSVASTSTYTLAVVVTEHASSGRGF